jgi:RNA polymerase sigma factor (sigma-70 family)
MRDQEPAMREQELAMREQELDRLFERFRGRGDVAALGAIFDATAPELLQVAMSLVREASEADDLLQETFLTAIERARRYDAERRLVPWLLGILVNHARERRRLGRRELDAERLAARPPSPPEVHALGRELEEALERALAELSARERSVLDAHLRHGKGAAEIAADTGAAPGAVRMQIHRGLDRLRKALPAGLAFGAAGGALGAQGLPAVRGAVLRAGETAARSMAAGAGSALGLGATLGSTAGVLMGKKLALAGIAAALVAGWFFLRTSGAPGESSPSLAASAPSAPGARVTADELLAPAAPLAQAPGASASTRAPSPSLRLELDPDRAALRGRVLEHDGVPVPDLPVALVEVDEAELFPARLATLGGQPPLSLLAAESVTDAEGTFELHGAKTRGIHALGLDLGGPRATLRMLEAPLVPGATAELGDVRLAPYGSLAGRVVDEDGRGIAGARVRAGALSEEILAFGLEGLAAGGAFGAVRTNGEVDFLLELPAWVSALEARLPLATTHTGSDGSFAFAHAPAGRLSVLVDAPLDAPGRARLASEPVALEAGERVELEPLVFARGASVRGRVHDADGRPVAGAEVRAGTQTMERGLAIFGPTLTSDAEGRFAAEGLAPERNPVVVARRDARSPWVVAREGDPEFSLELAPARELVLEVVDGAGAPVAEAEVFLRRQSALDGFGAFAPPFSACRARPVAGSPGRFALDGLADGHYQLEARAGLAQASTELDLSEGERPEVRLVLEAPRRVSVHVRDGAEGPALAGAHVRVEVAGLVPPVVLDSVRSDDDGLATLSLPARADGALLLRVEHARFAPSARLLEPSPTLEVALTSGARLVARADDPALARRGCTLQLQFLGDGGLPVFGLPRLVALPREGELVLERLPPGRWSWMLSESLAAMDPLMLLGARVAELHLSGSFTLVEGETHALVLRDETQAAPGRGLASISGVVRSSGIPVGDVLVSLLPVEHAEVDESVDLSVSFQFQGAGGRFERDELAPGQYQLTVKGRRTASDSQTTLVQDTLLLEPGEARELAYDVELLACRVRVLSADGEPVSGALLELLALDAPHVGAQGRTGPDGSARLELAHAGRYLASAREREHGAVRAELVLGAGEPDGYTEEHTLTLNPGVECAGTVRVPPDVLQDTERCFLMLSTPGGPDQDASQRLVLAGGRGSFRLTGLQPGRYTAWLAVDKTMLQASFELPEWGDGALELAFAPRE